MISLPFTIQNPPPRDPRIKAGHQAERQLAHYLHREFAQDPEVHVLNGLRIVDPNQPEHHGGDGVAQIDHLVLHRWGAFIVESKSVSETITVRSDGSGGDMWTRTYKGKPKSFDSPIRQAEFQGEFLRKFLQPRREQLLGKLTGAKLAMARVLRFETHQRSFGGMPIQVIVAISGNGDLQQIDGWLPPSEPLRTFVCKADNVASKIRHDLEKHRAGSSLLSLSHGEYGMWEMTTEEVEVVAHCLAENHTPRSAKPRHRVASASISVKSAVQSSTPRQRATSVKSRSWPSQPTGPGFPVFACRTCSRNNLSVLWGHSYYFKCHDCGGNTPIPATCIACDAKGHRGKTVKIRKEGPKFFRCCESCGIEERVWTNPASPASHPSSSPHDGT